MIQAFRRPLLDETFILAHEKLSLYLAQSVEDDTYGDDQTG